MRKGKYARERKYAWPGTAVENATEAVDILCEVVDLFQKLRPQIERVARGQERRRMPAEAYEIWRKLCSLGVNVRSVHEFLRAEAYPAEQPAHTPVRSSGLTDIDDFRSGSRAYHYLCEARRACVNGTPDGTKRELIAKAISELERYGRALSKSPAMVTIAETKWSNWPNWWLDKIEELRSLRADMKSTASASPPATAPKPLWNGRDGIIQFTREPGPFAGDTL